jgi:hypothetical protein
VQLVGNVTVAFVQVSALYAATYEVSPVVVVVVVVVVEAALVPPLQLEIVSTLARQTAHSNPPNSGFFTKLMVVLAFFSRSCT